MKAVFFDLDDTLYPERKFVTNGFWVCARFLAKRYGLDKGDVFSKFYLRFMSKGRKQIFDVALKELGIYSDDLVKLLVYLYRCRKPEIELYDDARPTISHLKDMGFLTGLITDGMASVQKNKVAALNIEGLFDIIVYTDEICPECWKPSSVPFKIALELLNVEASHAYYVGDNTQKDFDGPLKLGMGAIYINREKKVTPEIAGVHVIQTLSDVLSIVSNEHV
ncbi:MAG: HAD hydrolase-like protein [Candidatus Magnetoovum sp. WYHC-5]|nr:HAD hydrolase-like protein [Candidatus Magnetoovum sp. WYHC-5]